MRLYNVRRGRIFVVLLCRTTLGKQSFKEIPPKKIDF
jgi:hypothetical protein